MSPTLYRHLKFTAYMVGAAVAIYSIYDYWVEIYWGDPATISKLFLRISIDCRVFPLWLTCWCGIGMGHFFFIRNPTTPTNFIYNNRLIFALLLFALTAGTCILEYWAQAYWGDTALLIPRILAWVQLHFHSLSLIVAFIIGMETARLYMEQSAPTATAQPDWRA